MGSEVVAFSFGIRVLVCDHCGAPLKVTQAEGSVKCSYCQSQVHYRVKLPMPEPAAAGPQGPPRWLGRRSASIDSASKINRAFLSPSTSRHSCWYLAPGIPSWFLRTLQRMKGLSKPAGRLLSPSD